MVRPIGVLLAGGASTRMGVDKAMVEVAGRPMGRWVSEALAAACDEVVVAGRLDGMFGHPGIADTNPDRRGPLAGVVAALEHVSGPILVVATDQPWARPDTLRRLAAAASDLALVPVGHDGTRQTTCAVYPAGLLPVALDELLAGGSIQSVLDRASFTPVSEEEWRGWGEDGRSWYSADSPEAIAYGLRRFGTPSAPGSARQR